MSFPSSCRGRKQSRQVFAAPGRGDSTLRKQINELTGIANENRLTVGNVRNFLLELESVSSTWGPEFNLMETFRNKFALCKVKGCWHKRAAGSFVGKFGQWRFWDTCCKGCASGKSHCKNCAGPP